MKKVSLTIARPIIVKTNVVKAKTPDWMQISDASTGEILHTGRPAYIRNVAKRRYGQKVN